MVFHHVNDGMGNSINQMKDWHESEFNIHKKENRE
jgi:hypothetical protein